MPDHSDQPPFDSRALGDNDLIRSLAKDPEEAPRARLLRRHQELCDRAREIMEAKNRDYGADADPFRNFRAFGALGILVRLSDKLARARTYLERGNFAVKDEQIDDTLLDAINYVILLMAILEFGDECNQGGTTI
jgi:hypothetical protein